MYYIVIVGGLGCLALGIFCGDAARRELLGYLRDTAVHLPRLLLVRGIRVKGQHIHHLCVGVFRGQLPRYLQYRTVYLDAKEVLGLPCNGQCRLEGDNAVDVGHGGSSDVGVAVPRTGTLPREIVG